MLRPGFPRLSHPGVAHAIPSIAFIAQVYRGEPVVSSTISEVRLTDQQRPAQAPLPELFWRRLGQTGPSHESQNQRGNHALIMTRSNRHCLDA